MPTIPDSIVIEWYDFPDEEPKGEQTPSARSNLQMEIQRQTVDLTGVPKGRLGMTRFTFGPDYVWRVDFIDKPY